MYYVFIAFLNAFTATSAITSAITSVITYIEVKETEERTTAKDDQDNGEEVF